MALEHLGHQLDIHGGGADLIFPHHENEIAQSEAFPENRPFARYWMHNGLLQFSGEKMSKSIGNLVNIRELLERGDAMPFRLMVLQSIYRNPLVYTRRSAGGRAARRGAPGHGRARLSSRGEHTGSSATGRDAGRRRTALPRRHGRRLQHADRDCGAVSISRAPPIARQAPTSSALQGQLLRLAGVLGSAARRSASAQRATPSHSSICSCSCARNCATRSNGRWPTRLRTRLDALGVTIEDTAAGTTWRARG